MIETFPSWKSNEILKLVVVHNKGVALMKKFGLLAECSFLTFKMNFHPFEKCSAKWKRSRHLIIYFQFELLVKKNIF